MTLAAFAALNLSLVLGILSLGQHALEWRLHGQRGAESRLKSMALAAQVHSVSALALMILTMFFIQPAGLLAWGMGFLAAGMVTFCGALYLHALAGNAQAMVATLPGALMILIGPILIAFAFSGS